MTAAQVCHAAGESSPGNIPPGTYAVVLGVAPNELPGVLVRLRTAGIPCHPVTENDPPFSGQLMAIGVEPCPKEEVYHHLKRLNLLGDLEEKGTLTEVIASLAV